MTDIQRQQHIQHFFCGRVENKVDVQFRAVLHLFDDHFHVAAASFENSIRSDSDSRGCRVERFVCCSEVVGDVTHVDDHCLEYCKS